MPQAERMRVWRDEIKKTSGGLMKKDLMKNSRGKIVSRKKSDAAKKNKDKNNLAGWLRQKGEQFLSKGMTAEHVVRKGKRKKKLQKLTLPGSGTPEPKPKPVVKLEPKPKPKPKPVVKLEPKPKPKPKPVVKPKPKPKKKKKEPPKLTKAEPIKPGEDKDLSKVSVGNIIPEETTNLYTKMVNGMINSFSKETIIKIIGQPPPGFKWPKKT